MPSLDPHIDFAAGEVLLFDKEKEWTSFDVVKKVRNAIRIKKVGHAGTLDPLATGLLILCTGKKTKSITAIQGQEKEYLAEFRLGGTTPSYDAEFPPENLKDFAHLGHSEIEKALGAFRGEIKQIPPLYSAVKVKGQRAYLAARAGEEMELRPRFVQVHELELLDYHPAEGRGQLRIVCSKGTYIRSLVHDLGQALEVGAWMTELRRTRIGEHRVEDAWSVTDFIEALRALRESEA